MLMVVLYEVLLEGGLVKGLELREGCVLVCPLTKCFHRTDLCKSLVLLLLDCFKILLYWYHL